MIDASWPLVLPKFQATETFFVFLLVSFIRQMPRDTDSAARIDGAGHLRIFWAIIVPSSAPAHHLQDLRVHLELEQLPRPAHGLDEPGELAAAIARPRRVGEGITIEDNLALVVDYASGATLSYSLNAHSPWEGYRVAVNGTEGRAELEVIERGAVLADEGLHPVLDPSAVDPGSSGSLRPEGERLLVQRHWEPAVEVEIENLGGGHGGGDGLLLADVFEGPGDDPLQRPADWRDGVRAIAVGIAGNRSIETGMPVHVADLGIRLLAG